MNSAIVNSADSHVLEPEDLWQKQLPAALRERGPITEIVDEREVVYIDGKVVRRDPVAFMEAIRPPGAKDPKMRLADLDDQGIWSELMFPSRALWVHLSEDPELQLACARVYNDWLADEFMRFSRKPLWAAAAETGISLSFHIGTGMDPKVYRVPGGAITNHVVSFYGAQTTLSHLVASGVLEDHPRLHVSFVESGGSWLPAVMERMDEAQRQYGAFFLRPKLAMLPSEYVKRQLHISFQHGRAVLSTLDVTGVDPAMWGSDDPHLEGTFPDTKKVLDGIFEGADDKVRAAITGGNFSKLFRVAAPGSGS